MVERVIAALQVLTTARNPKALPHAETLLALYPDKTTNVCEYLASLAESHPDRIQHPCYAVLSNKRWSLGWQRAWIWSTVARVASAAVTNAVIDLAVATASFDTGTWIERVDAARVLGIAGKLDRSVVINLWERAPEVFQGELVEAVGATLVAQPATEWASRFLASVRQDPILAVVRHVPRARDLPSGDSVPEETPNHAKAANNPSSETSTKASDRPS